jgi:hypothetical protein
MALQPRRQPSNDNLPVVAVRLPPPSGFVDIVTMFPTPPGPGCKGAAIVDDVWLFMISEAPRGCWLTVLDEQVADTVFTMGTLSDLCRMLGDPAAVELDTIMTYITKQIAAYSMVSSFCGGHMLIQSTILLQLPEGTEENYTENFWIVGALTKF